MTIERDASPCRHFRLLLNHPTFRVLRLVALLLCAAPRIAAAAHLFSAGWEANGLSEFTSTGGTCGRTTDGAATGSGAYD